MSEDRTKALFDPINHGFFVLEGHQPPWKVRYSEFQNRPCVNGTHDYHRLNLYLTQDGEFVTVWFGSLDPMAIETLFLNNGVESVDYDEPFFRGLHRVQGTGGAHSPGIAPNGWWPSVTEDRSQQGTDL
jgi:hypothetical protein